MHVYCKIKISNHFVLFDTQMKHDYIYILVFLVFTIIFFSVILKQWRW